MIRINVVHSYHPWLKYKILFLSPDTLMNHLLGSLHNISRKSRRGKTMEKIE